VTSEGSAHSRFQRALTTGNPTLALATAAELPRVSLHDALRLLMLMAGDDAPRFSRAAARWHARDVLETGTVDLAESRLVLAALGALTTRHHAAATRTLEQVFGTRGLGELVSALQRAA
jgi:hypothetical protein